MKKVFGGVLLVLFSIILLCGCGVPKGVSKDIYGWSKQVVVIADNYYDEEVSSYDARIETLVLYMQITNMDKSLKDIDYVSELSQQEEKIAKKINEVHTDIMRGEPLSDLRKHRNELAELLNLKNK